MYPILWEPFGFPISTFGVMLAIGFLVAAWNTAVRLREYGLDPEFASTLLLYAIGGGVIGAKLYFAIDESLREGQPFTQLLFSRAGITWYGGLIGGTLAVTAGCLIHGLPVRIVASCVSVAALLGQACGRVGCFLVGDDYGTATDLPWGIAFPKGTPPTTVPVHPTQLYEIAWLLLGAAILWRRRKRTNFLFGEYLAWNGCGRFFIEFVRVNPKIIELSPGVGLTEPQLIGLGLVVFGIAGWVYTRNKPEPVVA